MRDRAERVGVGDEASGLVVGEAFDGPVRVGQREETAEGVVGVAGGLAEGIGDFGEVANFVVVVAGERAQRVGDPGELSAFLVVGERGDRPLFSIPRGSCDSCYSALGVVGPGGFAARRVGEADEVAEAVHLAHGAPAEGIGVACPFAVPVEAEDLLASELVGDQGAVATVVEGVVFARA